MDRHEREEDRERKKEVGGKARRKDDETKRRHAVLEKRYNGSTQKIRRKIESYSRKTDEKYKVTQERLTKKWKTSQEKLMMEKFLQITSTVGNQIQGMNSSIVKMKEEGDN